LIACFEVVIDEPIKAAGLGGIPLRSTDIKALGSLRALKLTVLVGFSACSVTKGLLEDNMLLVKISYKLLVTWRLSLVKASFS